MKTLYENEIHCYKKIDKVSISAHFKSSEFANKECPYVFVSDNLVLLLENIRKYFAEKYDGAIIKITSGYRNPEYNQKIGGSKKSFHMTGCAADFKIFKKINGDQIDALEVYAFCNKLNKSGGVGKYENFTHVDTRGFRSRW